MRTAETNPIFQSKVLPIIQKAETEIKELILVAFLYAQPKMLLLGSVLQIINRVKKDLPTEFGDLSAYTKGLVASADKMIQEGYNKPILAYNIARNSLVRTAPTPINITTPRQLFDMTTNVKDLWAEAKGSPNVVNYPKELKATIKRLAEMPTTTAEPNKKPISLWQKAELDTRYEHQMKNLNDLREEGVVYAYLSSHPNCSKRCQCWQGKLVSLNERATSPQKQVDKKFHYDTKSFIVGKLEGKNVYSLPDIMDVQDVYGYNNNIISGFNCRHRLIPFAPGRIPPKHYDSDDIAKQRDIEIKIREMERKIRLLKTNEDLYNKSGDKKTAKAYKLQWKKLEAIYKRFCERNGYSWNQYRIDIK
jgi:hypothetical protein